MSGDKICCAIQARMGSSRLPGKVLMPIGGQPMLAVLIDRVRSSRLIDDLVVATSTSPENDAIEELCGRIRCRCHRGSETDALGRILDASAGASVIVRLTGDNPFVDGTLIDLVLNAFLVSNPAASYASNVDGSGFPFGLFVEVAKAGALLEGLKIADDMVHEHVTWHLRQSSHTRRITVKAPCQYPDVSLSIDTWSDYERLRPTFEAIEACYPGFTYKELAQALAKGGH